MDGQLYRLVLQCTRTSQEEVAKGDQSRQRSDMRRPRILLRTLLSSIAVITVAVWWLSFQPRRRAKAIAATKQAGGVFQLDGEYWPDWQPKPPPVVDLTRLADKWTWAPPLRMTSRW